MVNIVILFPDTLFNSNIIKYINVGRQIYGNQDVVNFDLAFFKFLFRFRYKYLSRNY